MTKIEKMLKLKGMKQADLIRKIQSDTGEKIGRDRMSRICNGLVKNYTMKTAQIIADSLECDINDIIER
jgi:DNA-binding Xre family transcriptional regulator